MPCLLMFVIHDLLSYIYLGFFSHCSYWIKTSLCLGPNIVSKIQMKSRKVTRKTAFSAKKCLFFHHNWVGLSEYIQFELLFWLLLVVVWGIVGIFQNLRYSSKKNKFKSASKQPPFSLTHSGCRAVSKLPTEIPDSWRLEQTENHKAAPRASKQGKVKPHPGSIALSVNMFQYFFFFFFFLLTR